MLLLPSRTARLLLTVASCMFLHSPSAYAGEKLYDPYVEEGEWELEYFGTRTFDNANTVNNGQAHEMSVGYGINSWWKTEFTGAFEKEPQSSAKFDSVEWENRFQLTERGEYWVDAGVQLAYVYTPQENHPDALEGKLLL